MDADRKRALDRIKKCLNLSASSNANEAAAALRQAQKLMERHGITDDDIAKLDVESGFVVSADLWRPKLSQYLTHMVWLIETAFGVRSVFERVTVRGVDKTGVRYFGTSDRAQLAVYTHKVLWRTLQRQWREYAAHNPMLANQRGARTGFWCGYILGVRRKVVAFGGAEKEQQQRPDGSGTELVPTMFGKEMEKIDRGIQAHYKGDLSESGTNNLNQDDDARAAGYAAGQDFELHRPMEGNKQKQLTN